MSQANSEHDRVGRVRVCTFVPSTRDARWDLQVGPYRYFHILDSADLNEGRRLWLSLIHAPPKELLTERCTHVPSTLLQFFVDDEMTGGATIDWNSTNVIYQIDDIARQRRFDGGDSKVQAAKKLLLQAPRNQRGRGA